MGVLMGRPWKGMDAPASLTQVKCFKVFGG